MKIRLTGGVVASGRHAWIARPSGPVRLLEQADAPPGAAVALGPEEASDADAAGAVRELSRLVAGGGVAAAGAGVDLGAGFRSARLDGAHGDQRDAVLAALRAVGMGDAHRLGPRAGLLVALFGPAVTKPVGAAAARAVEDGRWAALHLASAASDVLGPEQLERVLALEAPEDTALAPDGPPSALARYFRQVFADVPGPRRLHLVLDLWERVLEHRRARGVRERRLATQARRDRLDALRERRRHHDDQRVLFWLRVSRDDFQFEPSLADAARWVPSEPYWHDRLDRLLQDALGATALLRAAAAVADHGLGAGLDRSLPLLRAAAGRVADTVAAHSARRVPGLTGLPARPAAHVRDLVRRLDKDKPRDAKFGAYVRPRLSHARDYALLVVEDAEALLNDVCGLGDDAPAVQKQVLRAWADSGLARWREDAGYGAARPPAEWSGIQPWTTPLLNGPAPLRERLAADPAADPAAVETVGDLLWYADLIDALAQLHGHERAEPTPGTGAPWYDHDPPPPDDEPLRPGLGSVTLAVSGAAQLAALGGVPPRAPRGWTEFTEGLMSATAISSALTGDFAVPPALAALDGTTVPGAGVRVMVARSARDLAEWAAYMGNCIAEYADEARTGRTVLLGLYGRDGLLAANAELAALKPAARGWRVVEIRARFNDDPPAELEQAFGEWAAAIPGTVPDEPGPPPEEPPPARAARRRAAPRLVEEAGPALAPLARRAFRATPPGASAALAAVAGTAPDAAPARLRRLGGTQLAGAVRRALDGGATDLVALWTATGHRPMASALDALDPGLRDRFDRLGLLLGEPPLPKALRRLVKAPDIAAAHAFDLAARRVRRAIGRLAADDDPVIAAALARPSAEPLLCALAVAAACAPMEAARTPVTRPRGVTVPGYPATSLDDKDGPWQRALPAARELGADTSVFWDEVAAHGLRVPASWLAHGGWPALWSRAHAHRRPVTAGGRS
ncbi:hypothetical protein HUT06_26345 [Actinomadura sp. NAK00032]|uniref:hypothetical protein n=1 Tax=Actinomadura sp. NAK00032 TaxID=2742128 RepID=UPI001590C55D|nr:hypothetical protein [Actinomadura sp. NAK00032]QKW37092.1 hypothetical protein HUT06_26345 [Actinomadura sp. NAK00032]